MDEAGRHSMLRAYKKTEHEEIAAYTGKNIRSYQTDYTLADPSLLTSRKEFELELTNHIQMIFPCLVVQQIQNTLATRHILPKRPGQFELLFTFFGYADDDEEIRNIRIKQANLVGPAGYISMEDGYATELVQQAIAREKDGLLPARLRWHRKRESGKSLNRECHSRVLALLPRHNGLSLNLHWKISAGI